MYFQNNQKLNKTCVIEVIIKYVCRDSNLEPDAKNPQIIKYTK